MDSFLAESHIITAYTLHTSLVLSQSRHQTQPLHSNMWQYNIQSQLVTSIFYKEGYLPGSIHSAITLCCLPLQLNFKLSTPIFILNQDQGHSQSSKELEVEGRGRVKGQGETGLITFHAVMIDSARPVGTKCATITQYHMCDHKGLLGPLSMCQSHTYACDVMGDLLHKRLMSICLPLYSHPLCVLLWC